MDISWNDMQLFLAVAETQSLSAAARRLRVAQPTVSRRLADLEAQLGEALFVRSVEGAALTSFGERLVAPAQHMAEWAAEITRVAEHRHTEPAGVVRLTAPPGIAFDFVAPFAAWLRRELPKVRLEVIATVAYLDLARREADLALRLSRPTQRDLLCLASLKLSAVPYAAKRYAKRLAPRAPVAAVDWIGWAPPMDHLTPNPELARLIPGFAPVFASDDFLVQLRAAEVGLGAIFLGRARHRFARHTPLVELDIDFPPVPIEMHLICAKSALAIPRIRAVADHLVAELAHTDTH